MIRIEAAWLAVSPLDMRAGTDTALARVVAVFGAAPPHHASPFANKRANRLKVTVCLQHSVQLAPSFFAHAGNAGASPPNALAA